MHICKIPAKSINIALSLLAGPVCSSENYLEFLISFRKSFIDDINQVLASTKILGVSLTLLHAPRPAMSTRYFSARQAMNPVNLLNPSAVIEKYIKNKLAEEREYQRQGLNPSVTAHLFANCFFICLELDCFIHFRLLLLLIVELIEEFHYLHLSQHCRQSSLDITSFLIGLCRKSCFVLLNSAT